MSSPETPPLSSGIALPKVISPAVHGMIDYSHVIFFFTVGMFCRHSNKRAAAAAFLTSGFVLVQSLLTDYPLGLRPVIPFETHGKMDAVFAAGSWIMPQIFGFQGTTPATIFELNTLAESTVVALTDWNSDRARREA